MMMNKDIQLTNREIINTTLYAGDQILMAISEDELQAMAYRLNLIPGKYNINVSSTKTKPMAMCGNHTQRVKIAINDNPIEEVSDFEYLGHIISDYKSDLEYKIQTYNKINDVM
jgi:hypothetical protein